MLSVFIFYIYSIPCPFFVGRVKQQRNPTHLLGYGYGSHVATQAIATALRFYGFGSIPNSRNLAASLSAL
jgi:hypothetical protein